MTMTLDSSQQRFGSSHMNFDYQPQSHSPAFSNPWPSSSSHPQPGAGASSMYMNSHPPPPPMNPSLLPGKPHPNRASTSSASSLASYGSMPVPTSSADMMSMNRLPPTSGAYGDPAYSTSASSTGSHFAPTSAPPYDTLGYAPAPVRPAYHSLPPAEPDARRFSQSSVPPIPGPLQSIETLKATPRISMVDIIHRGIQDDRRGFADALDASHGMLAMSQETPRNIYGTQRGDRSSVDSYGFPSTHSTSSSVSSNGNFSSYYPESVSDYSTAGSDIESVNSRTLPRPQGFGSHVPPAPQSMMGQFSSKVSSSTQKKHKCKVCDKRFTRPSSLQTHMYSHTGEKPFACEVEGCGRHFSVVSNLRRHRKVHRGDAPSEAGSEDHHSD